MNPTRNMKDMSTEELKSTLALFESFSNQDEHVKKIKQAIKREIKRRSK